MSVMVKDSLGRWVQAAGQGKAEYGASTERKGDIAVPATTAGNHQSVSVVFAQAMPDNDYTVVIDEGSDTWAHCTVNVTNKTATGFTLFFLNVAGQDAPQMTFKYRAFKLYTDTEYNSLLDLPDRVEALETLASDVIPSEASASNKLVTANEADLLTIPLAKFQIGSGGAVGYADLGTTTSTISQAFSWLEVEYGRVDGFIDKYFISVAGASSNPNYIRVVRLTNYGQTPTITLDANKHIWMSMDTYVYIRVKSYGNFSISGTLSRTAPTGTTIPINRLVTEDEINPTLTATFTAASGLKSGSVTVQRCKKIGDGLAVVTGRINKNTVLTVADTQSNIGSLGITGHTSVGTNPTSLFLWSQGVTPQCVSSVWKTTGGWIAVPWENGDYTLSEDAWFNAVVRYD